LQHNHPLVDEVCKTTTSARLYPRLYQKLSQSGNDVLRHPLDVAIDLPMAGAPPLEKAMKVCPGKTHDD
jgi:hypothetical protein